MEPDHISKRYKRSTVENSTRKKRNAPYTIYPEILVIVDYDGYRLHGGDNLQVKRYFVSFWNGVDLRYKLLKGPKVRISIAGIIISRVSNMYLFSFLGSFEIIEYSITPFQLLFLSPYTI